MRIRQLADGWTVFLRDDDDTEVFRFKAPPDATQEDYERFAEHVRKLAESMTHGPN